MNIGIIGLGLIGGSFALAARKHISGCVLFGEDINEEHQKQALSLNLIDQELTISNYAEMDVIILAVPVDTVLERADILLDQMNDNALLMDAGSTKASICTLLEWALQWFKNMEMKVQEMDPKEHDKHIAYVSHLSHISSFMLGKTVMEKEKDEKAIFAMAGSGFASTVRLAKSSPAMWTPIFQQNQDNILEVLKQYIANLEEFKSLMEQSNYDAIHQKMKQTNAIREILAGIK